MISDLVAHIADHDFVVDIPGRMSDCARLAGRVRLAYRPAFRSLAQPPAHRSQASDGAGAARTNRAVARRVALARGRYCLQRITIDRFLIFAPKIPATDPPAVAPLSASFDITS